ncbi:hypothetical protein [Brevundimonas sp.]|uniref:hypothetical protein n=1 Tax=Brevundimonas sp. TaxID=1871086 RepID=UPI002D2FFF89|nr:hypothetical protein [Brevundimonas sp.]HYC98489.1 hypothetical protein [Brevundimonas sp.]
MTRDLRKQARGPRMVNGEKRNETVKASITYSELQRTDANRARLGMSRALYAATALEAMNDLVESGSVPTGPMEHWQQIAVAARGSLIAMRDQVDRQIEALGTIALAASGEIAATEAEAEGERHAA